MLKDELKLYNQLLLYIADQPPAPAWDQLAGHYRWDVLHHSELLGALGAFVMLMPGIVIIDRQSAVGGAVLAHLEDVLATMPQPLLIVVELGMPDAVTRYGPVVRIGATSAESAVCLFSQATQSYTAG